MARDSIDPVAPAEAPPAGPHLNGYELRRIIGRGAAGTVWEAWDPKLNRRAAVKVVRLAGKSTGEREELLARFRQEAQITAGLQHQGVVSVFGYDETPDEAFLIMEYVDGETLRDIVARDGALPLERIIAIMASCLTTLDHCHQRGIVHRDIKPSNIMVTKAGDAKVADFGVARRENSDMTIVGTMIGTIPYMSPEQFTAKFQVDGRTDIWSCGVVLYELLTGQRPFRGDVTTILHQVVQETPAAPSSLTPRVTPAMDAVVARALEKLQADRFPNAAAFAAALRAAARAPAPDTERRPARRAILPLLGSGLAVVAIGVGAVTWWSGTAPVTPPATAPGTAHGNRRRAGARTPVRAIVRATGRRTSARASARASARTTAGAHATAGNDTHGHGATRHRTTRGVSAATGGGGSVTAGGDRAAHATAGAATGGRDANTARAIPAAATPTAATPAAGTPAAGSQADGSDSDHPTSATCRDSRRGGPGSRAVAALHAYQCSPADRVGTGKSTLEWRLGLRAAGRAARCVPPPAPTPRRLPR